MAANRDKVYYRQRFTSQHPCPICGGHPNLPQGKGKRCAGYLTADREWAHCTREEYAGRLSLEKDSPPSYHHKLTGSCGCGSTHGAAAPTAVPLKRSQANAKAPDTRRQTGETRYTVRNADGSVAGLHVRRDFLDADGVHSKTFSWVDHNGRGSVEMPLYGLPEHLAAPATVLRILCEGEKSADAINAALKQANITDALALATVTGASAVPCDESLQPLVGYRVATWADNDKPGRDHMRSVAQALFRLGAERPQYVAWSDAPIKGDAADYLANGGTAAAMLAMVKDRPSSSTPASDEAKPSAPYRPDIQTAQALMAKQIAPARWAVRELFAEGLTILAGKPKKGKSSLILHVGSAIACGGAVLGKIRVERGEVLYLALEDNERRMQERLARQLADALAPEALYITYKWRPLDRGGLDDFTQWMAEHPTTRLIAIDTWKKVKPVAKSGNTPLYDADYEALAQLQTWAIEHHVGVVPLMHLRKQPQPDEPVEEISGSTGVTGVADNIVLMRQFNGETTLVRVGRDYSDDEVWNLQGDRDTLLWTLTGDAAVTRVSKERLALYTALKAAHRSWPADLCKRMNTSSGSVRAQLLRAMNAGDEHVRRDDDGYYYEDSNPHNSSNTRNESNTRNNSVASANQPVTGDGENSSERNNPVTGSRPDGFWSDGTSVTAVTGVTRSCMVCRTPLEVMPGGYKPCPNGCGQAG